MPSPSTARHRGSIIRQLSLQSQPSAQPPAGRRGLKKQLSEDENRARALDSVEITGQGWSISNDRPEAGLRAGVSEGPKYGHAKTVTAPRPRPVKLAWADRKQEAGECPSGVEVVARKCQGQPRPLTVKAQRITNLPLLGDKDSLVYTRQQLAERLRIAWREREKHKPNLNIFLAHASETARSGSEEPNSGRSGGVPQTEIIIQDSITFRSVSASESSLSCDPRRSCATEPVRSLPRDTGPSEHGVRFAAGKAPAGKGGTESERKSILKNVTVQLKTAAGGSSQSEEENIPQHEVGLPVADCPDFKTFPVGEPSSSFGNNLTNLNFQMKSLDVVSQSEEGEPRDKENVDCSPRSDSGYSEHSKTGKMDEAEEEEAPCKGLGVGGDEVGRALETAQERRASFRSGSLLNKAIDDGYTPPGGTSSEEADDDVPLEGEIKVFLKKNEEKRPQLTRTFSAPTRNGTTSPKQAPSQASPKMSVGFKALPRYTSSVDLVGVDEDLNALRGRIKSAPIRRKLKTAANRRKHRGKDPDSSDDEKKVPDGSRKKISRKKATSRMGGSDIVTMVSLVSPATSDAEESAMPMPEETWAAEEKEEKATAAVDEGGDKGRGEPPKEISSFIIQKFVSLRKSNKTVSFVQHPPINRSYSASFPSRRAPAGTPIIIPTPVITTPALTPAQLQEREKRTQPPYPAASAGTDNRGVKRRLIRTASAPQVKENDGNAAGETCVKAEHTYEPLTRKGFDKIEESKEEERDEKKEPEFKTPKEKECWMLYQKMLEKGVSVSFDTVLRGMLTPTEYRLRRNQLLSSC